MHLDNVNMMKFIEKLNEAGFELVSFLHSFLCHTVEWTDLQRNAHHTCTQAQFTFFKYL